MQTSIRSLLVRMARFGLLTVLGASIILLLQASLFAEESNNEQASESPAAQSKEDTVLEDIARQKSMLDAQRRELEARENELKAREKALEDEVAKLKEIRKEIVEAETKKRVENEAKVQKLVETIEMMSPKSASKLLADIEEDLAIDVMAKLSTEKLSKLLGQMDVQNSSRLSERYTGYMAKKRVNGPVYAAPKAPQQAAPVASAREPAMKPAAGGSDVAKPNR